MKTRAAFPRLAALAAGLALAGPALAAPRIEFSIAQFREVVERKGGTTTTRMVPAQSVSPGDVVEYVLTYTNRADAAATDARIDDAIPKGTTYIANTATGEGAEVTFSSDGGKTFAPAVKLTYEIRLASGAVEKRVATPAEYTHVRFTLKKVLPGATGKVAFRVKVK
ncbi:MAG TPA: hypothetical protein VLS93_11505 [Anaeromyxobacteraceae bacterium]|nr:hypothetical protein [Anaeromyxobacteraceae bacterium]